MQDNEFEKQVHEKLAHMQMEASDTVWQRVEDGLDGKSKRRRWLIWLPVATAGILLFGVFYLNIGVIEGSVNRSENDKGITMVPGTPGIGKNNVLNKEEHSGRQVSGADSRPSELREVKTTDTSSISAALVQDESLAIAKGSGAEVRNGSMAKSGGANRNLPGTGSTTADKLKIESGIGTASRPGIQLAIREEITRPIKPGKELTHAGKIVISKEHSNVTSSTGNSQKATKFTTIDKPLIASYNPITPGSVIQSQHGDENISEDFPGEISPRLIIPIITNINTFSTDSAIKYPSPGIYFPPATLVVYESGWRWGINFSAGRSGITTGKLNTLFSSDALNAPNYSAGNPGNAVVRRPSQIRPGLTISLGVFAEKQIDPSVYLKAGVQFSRFAANMQVGSFRPQSLLLQSTSNMADRSVSSYYTGERSQRYLNAYSYVDIPVSLGINFASGTRFPFAWEFGLAPSILLATNALHFNQASSVYYKDNSLFKKTQMAFITALPVRLYNGNKYALMLSPLFRYNTSELFRPEVEQRKHLLFAGAGLSLNLKK